MTEKKFTPSFIVRFYAYGTAPVGGEAPMTAKKLRTKFKNPRKSTIDLAVTDESLATVNEYLAKWLKGEPIRGFVHKMVTINLFEVTPKK